LSFEVNQGQTESQVKFLSRGRGYSLFLTANEAVLALQQSKAKVSSADPFSGPAALARFESFETPNSKLETGNSSLATGPEPLAPSPGSSAPDVLRLKLVGANPAAQVTALEELPGKSNYFIGNDPKKWRTNVPNYAKVQYKDVYPGVDLVYYGNQRQLEYDFVVSPGADPKAIRLGFETGNSKLETGDSKLETRNSKFAPPLQIDADGDLVVSIEGGELRFHKPVVYQVAPASGRPAAETAALRRYRDGRYVLLADNRIAFEVGDYDRTKPLIIDPVLSYSTYLGGSGSDSGFGIAVDSAGNAYVTGQTASTDFPTASALQASNGGGYGDAFVTKLNAAGSALVYSTYIGGSDYDTAYGIAVDSSGNAYITGSTASGNFPTTTGAFQTMADGGACSVGPCAGDAFVTKLGPAGDALLYSTYLGGSSGDVGYGMAVDSSGNAYVTGHTDSTNFPTLNSFQAANAGESDAFVAKLNAAGSALAYSTYLGGSSYDYSQGIAVDASGNAYVTGLVDSTNFPTLNSFQAAKAGAGDAYVAKIDPSQTGSASLVYSTYLGGTSDDYPYAIAVDSSGNAYVTGETYSTDFPTQNGLQSALAGSSDVFVTKLNALGLALVYSTFLGGSSHDEPYSIAVDSSGNAYVAGHTYSTDFPLASPTQGTLTSNTLACEGTCADAFVTKLNSTGSELIFSSFLGGTDTDYGYGIALDPQGNAYVTGYTSSTDFPTTSGAFHQTCGTDATCNNVEGPVSDAFVAKFSDLVLGAGTTSSTSLNFRDQLVGTTSAPQTITLTNAGDGPLQIWGIAVGSGDFAETHTDCPISPSTAAPGDTCNVSVTFTPTRTGARGGYLVIDESSHVGPDYINLSGTGVSPIAVLSPPILSFGNQPVGSSATQTVTLTNDSTATAALVVSGIVATGDYAQTSGCVGTLAIGESCTITVTFTPTAAKTSVGAVVISDNAPDSPQSVTLTGSGGSAAAVFCPTAVVANNQTAGADAAVQTAALTNPDKATQARVSDAYGMLPLSFEENRGQADAQVKFLSRGKGYALALAPSEAVLALTKSQKRDNSEVSFGAGVLGILDELLPAPLSLSGLASEIASSPTIVVKMKLVGANPAPKVSGLGELPGKSNYLFGNDPKKWRTETPNYAGVIHQNVYPGVSLIYYGNQGQLEYDFIVSPGADPRVIALDIQGADELALDAAGNLLLRTPGGEVSLHEPHVYQEVDGRKKKIEGRYIRKGQFQVAFEIAAYDPGKPLVIDPVLSYSTYLGGTLPDVGVRIAVDSACNAYVAGVTVSPDFPKTAGVVQSGLVGSGCRIHGSSLACPAAFVTKLNAAGSAIVYSTYLGGSNGEGPTGIAVDSSGNVYLAGGTGSTDFPTTPGAFQRSLVGRRVHAFVSKLDASGSALLYSTLLGGSEGEVAAGIAVDSAGNAYVAGGTSSADFPTAGAFQISIGSSTCTHQGKTFPCPDAFVTKLNPTGSALVYSSFLGGSDIDAAFGIAVDAAGNAYVAGATISTDFPTLSPFQSANAGGICGPTRAEHPCADAFVSKLNPAGSALAYSTYLGGNGDDGALGIAVDSLGSAYVTGLTNSSNFPTTVGSLQPAFGGGLCGVATKTIACPDAFVTKLTAAGSALAYSTYLGGNSYDMGWGIAVDPSGNAFVVGVTGSSNFPTANALQGTLVGTCTGGGVRINHSTTFLAFPCPDAFVTKLNGAGSAPVYSTYLGGTTYDIGLGIAVDAAGGAYVTGGTLSTNFPTANPLQAAFAGFGDAFVAKISTPAVILPSTSLSFGNQLVGSTSSAQTLTLTNSGNSIMTITSIVTSGEFAATDTCGGSVAPGANCPINITFKPTATGAQTGTLTITDTAPGSPQVIALSGTGTVPAVTLSAEVLTFQHNINIDCPPKTVALTNSGTGPLAITGIVATGDFTQANTCGTSLAAGASCDISVIFKPTAEGLVAGAVTITDNAADSPQVVALAGTGLPPCLLITLAQTATVVRGMDSTAFSISDPKPSCHTSAIGLACQRTGPVSCLFNPQTIPPSGSSALTLRNLKALAADALNFRVTGTSGRDTTALDLVVLVSDFSFNTSPASVTLEAGQTASYSLAIAPSNRLTGTVQLSCSGAPAGATCAVTPSAVTLDGSKPGQANVKVTTTARALASPGGGDGRYGRPGGSPLLWLLALVGLAALLAVWRLRALKPAPTLALAGMLLLILVWAACGGGGGFVSTNGPSGTPAGSYSLKVTGTYTSASAGTSLSHDTTLTLKVN
jgi:hypothetical protein